MTFGIWPFKLMVSKKCHSNFGHNCEVARLQPRSLPMASLVLSRLVQSMQECKCCFQRILFLLMYGEECMGMDEVVAHQVNAVDVSAMFHQELNTLVMAIVCTPYQRGLEHLPMGISSQYRHQTLAEVPVDNVDRELSLQYVPRLTTFRCSMSAPSSKSSFTQVRWPAAKPSQHDALSLKIVTPQIYLPLPAARRSGGSPQWSDSFSGAP